MQKNNTSQMWEIYGDKMAKVAVRQSFEQESDFRLNDLCAEDRKRHLLGDLFLEFHAAMQIYNPSMNVPIMAFLAQKSRWMHQSAKRNNARRSKREELMDFNNPQTLSNVHSDINMEKQAFLKDMICRIHRLLAEERPTLLPYFEAAFQVAQEENSDKDTLVAERLHCTRANVGKPKR